MNFKDKCWLEKEISKGKKPSCIAKEQGISPALISYYIKKYSIEKPDKNYNNKDWLEKKYLNENMSASEIGNLCGVTGDMIYLKLKEFNISKDTDSIVISRRKTMLEKYGAPTPMQSELLIKKINETKIERYGTINTSSLDSSKQKMKETSITKYGVDTYLNTEHARKSLKDKNIENEKEYDFFGKSSRWWAQEYDTNYFYVINVMKNCLDEEHAVCLLENFTKHETGIEKFTKNFLNIELYNKYFDLIKYPTLRYKPDFKLSDLAALNVDGLYWHSEFKQPNKKYHFEMRQHYESLGNRIFQFRADEVYHKIKIVKSIVDNYMGLIEDKIYARKCTYSIVSQKDADIFLNDNHIMGTIAAKHIGLYHNKVLVSLYSYKVTKNKLNVDRFCSKINTSVVGGFSKLLSRSIKIENPKIIDFWVDLRYGTGNFLLNQGFTLEKETLGWKWTDFNKTYNRLKCRANMDDRKLTEKEHAAELGLHKIYDAGQRLWRKVL